MKVSKVYCVADFFYVFSIIRVLYSSVQVLSEMYQMKVEVKVC